MWTCFEPGCVGGVLPDGRPCLAPGHALEAGGAFVEKRLLFTAGRRTGKTISVREAAEASAEAFARREDQRISSSIFRKLEPTKRKRRNPW